MNSVDPQAVDKTLPSTCFRLKAGLFPMTLLEVQRFDRDSFSAELELKVAQAPGFFQQAPVILSIDAQAEGDMTLPDLVELCRGFGLCPVVLRGGTDTQQQQAVAAGLALMPEAKARHGKSEPEPESAVAETEAPASVAVASPEPETMPLEAHREPLVAAASSRVITTPVRSGQQVYASGGDLIVLSSVSAGAEVLADGNIHVYGTLRGRALAGVRGDSQARIFCQSLEAELISIAGDFQLSEDLRGPQWKQPVQISLNEQKLTVEPLS